MAKWWRKLWCWITGGHTYADMNLQCYRDELNMAFKYRNRCCKCGEVDEWEIPMENLVPKRMKRPSTYVYDEIDFDYGAED